MSYLTQYQRIGGNVMTTGTFVENLVRRRLRCSRRWFSCPSSVDKNGPFRCKDPQTEKAITAATVSPLTSSFDSNTFLGTEGFHGKSLGQKIAASFIHEKGSTAASKQADGEANPADSPDVSGLSGSQEQQKPPQTQSHQEEHIGDESPEGTTEDQSRSQQDSSASSSDSSSTQEKHSPIFEFPHSEDIAERMFRCVRIFAGSSIGYPFSLSRYLGRWWWSWMFRKLCIVYEHESFHLEVERAAKHILPFLFDKVLKGDWESLKNCVEETLLNELKSATEALKGSEGKSEIDFSIDMGDVMACRLVGLRVIFGGERNSPTHGKTLITAFTPVGMSHFLLDEDSMEHFIRRRAESARGSKSMKSTIRRGSEILRDAMRRGALVRIDLLCRTQQTLTLKTDALMMASSHPETLHHLRFEASLEPNDEPNLPSLDFRQDIEQGAAYFKWGEGWKLVDINFVLKGNYPFHFANFKDERSINAIARDASFPFHVTSAEHPRAREDGYTVVTKQGAKPDKEEDFPVMST